MTVLAAEGIKKSYGDVEAVRSVTFELSKGVAIGIIGESGSGKSTLARMLTGLEPCDEGSIYLSGEKLTNQRSLEQRRRLQLIFQDSLAALNPSLTIGQSIEDFLYVHRIGDQTSRRKRMLDVISEVHLPPTLAERKPADVSGGQRQRACIARALALSPDILVADEPTSALDASIQGQVLNVLVEEKQRGLALVIISHDIDVIRCVADHVLVMLDGMIIEAGPRDNVVNSPSHPYSKKLMTTHRNMKGS
jgi:peptide/nickel transport system ATP-binding protein